MAGRGERWDRTLDTMSMPDDWPVWARRVFLCTLPISVMLYAVLIILPWTYISAAAHFSDWAEKMWKR